VTQPDKPRNLLYGQLAHLWPLLSPPEDYAYEASLWRNALQEALGPGRHSVLELGVGGGHNMSHLTDDFAFTAVDLSPDMLELSKRLNPGVEHHVGDMRSVRLGRTFDAVMVHDAISYMLSEQDVRAVLATARAHLRPGGVFITAPEHYKESMEGSAVSCYEPREQDGVELTFVEYVHDPDPADTTIEAVFVYILKDMGTGQVRVEQDRHVWGLFSMSDWEGLFKEAGFSFQTLPYPVHEEGPDLWLLTGRVP